MLYLEGTHAVTESLRAGKALARVLVDRHKRSDSAVQSIIQLAQDQQVLVQYMSKEELDHESQTGRHQGVIAIYKGRIYVDLEDILLNAQQQQQDPLVVVLDDIVDPHNVGAIIRSAEALGAHGVVLHERRAAGLTPTVVRAAAGALAYLPIARVTNIHNAVRDLKERGLWTLGLDVSGTRSLPDIDGRQPLTVVVGSEERGLSKPVKKLCEDLVKIPMAGRVQSLNASVATAVLLWEVCRSRLGNTRA